MYIYEIHDVGSSVDWGIGPIAGLQLEFGNTGTFERFFSTFSIYYSQVNHYFPLNKYGTDLFNVEVLTKNIYISASLNYIYPPNKLKPFAGFGISYFGTLKSSEAKTDYIVYNPKKSSIGSLLIAGVTIDLTKKSSLKFEAQYFNNLHQWIKEGSILASKNSNFNFLLTYQYKLIGK
jgi:hypothetical protein